MIQENSLNKGIRYLKERGPRALFYGIIYFVISRKNKLIESIKFNFTKIKNRKGKYQTKVNSSLMYLDLKDKGISRELCVNKKRECFSTEFMKNFVKNNDIIIDIGANIGYYALLESTIAKKGKIYAIEPIPKNRELLIKNIKLNNYKNISVFPYAIGNKEGKENMYIYEKGNWCSFTEKMDSKIINTIEVPLITLDKFVKKHLLTFPTLIRMDVEGYEFQIIKGMKDILKSNKPLKIFMELHTPQLGLASEENMRNLIGTLKRYDFKIKAIFLEPEPRNYRNIKITNKLSEIIGINRLGFVGDNYDDLDKLISSEDLNCAPMLFFERR